MKLTIRPHLAHYRRRIHPFFAAIVSSCVILLLAGILLSLQIIHPAHATTQQTISTFGQNSQTVSITLIGDSQTVQPVHLNNNGQATLTVNNRQLGTLTLNGTTLTLTDGQSTITTTIGGNSTSQSTINGQTVSIAVQGNVVTISTSTAPTLVTFTPKVIPFSDPEIGNPWRTPIYASGEEPPPGLPVSEAYQRWCWSELEPSQGQYDFSKVEALMAQAKSQGGKAGFRIMPVNTSGQSGSCLPAYLRSQIGEPPDWNNPAYLDRAQALLTALGQKYDNDPRMGWFEIGPYGNWGEWNLWTLPNNPMSPENKQKLIQMAVTAFPHKQLLMLSDADQQDGGGYDALSYAMNLSPNIGIRSDCLGSSDFGGATQGFSAAPDRWKQAPVVLEYCGGADFKLAYDQITTYHATMLADGDGNLKAYSSYSSSDQQQIVTNFKTAGYRFILDKLSIPAQIGAGSGFSVVTQWSNVNVTPAYLPWDVRIQLRSSSGTVVWQAKSQTNLDTLLPTTNSGADTPVSVTDNFNIPGTVPSSAYTVTVQILDPQNYYKPLQLAIQGRQADGSYQLGTVTVADSAGPTSTCP